MSKYFKNVKSFENLKAQYKGLLKANHPDNGGDLEAMKEINIEYDALFPIWKNRREIETGTAVNETADSTRRQFYTENGWKGGNHSWNRSLKEVAQIVRAYVKEKYPTYKFSVRTSYASMCQELYVELKESPIAIYKNSVDELTQDERRNILSKLSMNHIFTSHSFTLDEANEAIKRAWEKESDFYKCLNEAIQVVVEDVDAFVESYNYKDCDGMIDYFHVDFYYSGCCKNNGKNIKIVPKTVRIKNETAKPTRAKNSTPTQENTVETANTALPDSKTNYTYKITKGEDTRDGSELWVVRIEETLDREAYIAESKAMQERGGYYNKFKHGFIFRFNPTEILEGKKAA